MIEPCCTVDGLYRWRGSQEPSQKLIDIDTAVTMLAIVMPQEPLMPRFCEFLKEQTEYKVINFDQWTSFLRFAQEASDPSALRCCGSKEMLE